MKRKKALNYAKDFIIILCSLTISTFFTAEVLHKNGFFIEMITFVITNVILVGIYELTKFLYIRFKKGDKSKIDFKQQLHDLIFVVLIAVIGSVVATIFT